MGTAGQGKLALIMNGDRRELEPLCSSPQPQLTWKLSFKDRGSF